jgi:hypothetical protein
MERKPGNQQERETKFAGFPDLFTAEHAESAEFSFRWSLRTQRSLR